CNRTNGSQIRLLSDSGTPSPSSSTHNTARLRSSERLTATVCPSGPYFTALPSRFSRICRNAPSSTGATTRLAQDHAQRIAPTARRGHPAERQRLGEQYDLRQRSPQLVRHARRKIRA